MADFSAFFDEIISNSNIVDLAKALGVSIGPKKANYTLAICPFHADTQPSLALFEDSRNPHYHCFACGAHGGLIDLVERKEGISRNEAIRWISQQTGVRPPPFLQSFEQRASEIEKQSFKSWLQSHNSSTLLKRFAELRHIDSAVIRQAGGRAINMSKLELSALSPSQIESWERTGVLVRRKGELTAIAKGNQIVFPVKEGFVFRAVRSGGDSTKGERYRFSKGLKKSDILFGAQQAGELLSAGDQRLGLFVVEGLMDVLRMQSLGFAAVGLLGTAVSKKQAEYINVLCSKLSPSLVPVHLFLDADAAGRRASTAALRELLTVNVPVPVDVIWPDRDGDPDELFRGTDSADAVDQIAAWTHSALAVLVASYTGYPVGSAFRDLTASSALKRVETLRYIQSQLGSRWGAIRDMADPTAVFMPGADDQEGDWLRDSLDRAANFHPKAMTRPPQPYKGLGTTALEADVQLRRALRIAQSSNFRREYPFDWGGMTRLALAAKASTMTARELLKDADRKPLPYAARLVPKDDGRTRLKAGPWPEDSLLQQYVLSELLRARPETPGWYTGFPAVRRIRTTSAAPIMTGPDDLRPVGPPDEISPVVAFAYQIDQEIVEGESPPAREGMFVPYRECWQQFIDYFDNFVARQPLDSGTFFAVRLDISGFFDNLPRYAVDNVLRRAVADAAERCFAGQAFSSEVADLLAPDTALGEAENRSRAEFVADWLADQSFGYRYFDPGSGDVLHSKNATVGVPQGPDLSAFLANMALFPLDHSATALIEKERTARINDFEPKPIPAAAYGRYVDDMVIVSRSEDLLSDIETLIGESLRRLGLSMNAKHERTKAMSRRRIRDWLLGENGAAVVVSASGEETPSTDRTQVSDLLTVTADTPRSRVLQLLYHPELFSDRWALDKKGFTQVDSTLQNLRSLPSVKLRYNDWISAARWALHSFALRAPTSSAEDFARHFWFDWKATYLPDLPTRSFGESEKDFANRRAHLTIAPLTLVLDGLERSIDSRHDRRTNVETDIRHSIASTRARLASLVYEHDFCEILLSVAAEDVALASVMPRVETMLRMQCLAIRGLASTVCAGFGVKPRPMSYAPTNHYALRRFTINALHRDIAFHAAPFTIDVGGSSKKVGSPEAEPLLALHETIARLLADSSLEEDPLNPIEAITHQNLARVSALVGEGARGLMPALYLTKLVNQLLSTPDDSEEGPDTEETLRAFIEIVSGSSNSNQRLQERNHLFAGIAGEDCIPIAVPPGVDVRAFFANCPSQLKAFSVVDRKTALTPKEVIFGANATLAASDEQLAEFVCEVPSTNVLFQPTDRKIKPEHVSVDDVMVFAKAYRDLAKARSTDLQDGTIDGRGNIGESNFWPVTPFHLFAPKNSEQPWRYFGAVAGLPVDSQAFVRLTRERLHSVAVHANGKHLWQIGFAVADALGYRGFVRSSELDRLSVSALEPADGLDAVPFYMLQLTIPRLCGAFMGRSRKPIPVGPELPAAIRSNLERLESLSTSSDNALHLARLLELGAETTAADLIRDAPAPLQVAGVLSAVFGAVGRAAGRGESIFAEHMPRPTPSPATNRRIVDLWLQGASRLEGLGPERTTLGLRTAAAGMRVFAISRLLQALTLEVWSLLPDETRFSFEDFLPDLTDIGFSQELLLVRRGQSQSAPTAEDQIERLLIALSQHAVPGATSRNALDQVTPLGWLVVLATITGLLDLEPRQSASENRRLRPDLHSARREMKSSRKSDETEKVLWNALKSLAQFLGRGPEDDSVDAVEDSSWPWNAFAPLVGEASRMVDLAREVALSIEDLYGLVAETRTSRLFQVSEADDKGYCLIARDGAGRQNLAGWQIDRDSLGVTRSGDLECRVGAMGEQAFVWSETRSGERLVALSLAYRSLSDFAGQSMATRFESVDETNGSESVDDRGAVPPSIQPSEIQIPVDEPHSADDEVGQHTLINVVEQELTPPITHQSRSNKDVPLPAVGRVKEIWHSARKPRISSAQRSTLRIALLQMNVDHIGHSFYHPVCEVGPRPYREWEDELRRIRRRGATNTGRHSWFEARRRAILREALERCKTLDVDLLILPEYSVRSETVAWLSEQSESIGADTAILAGTFRHPSRGSSLAHYKGLEGRQTTLGAVVPLIVPGRMLGDGARSRDARIYARLKKYPSTGLSELIRPESRLLKAVYDIHARDEELPERLRYVRDLVCSEVFVAMAPANIFSAIPPLLELHDRFGSSASVNSDSLEKSIIADLSEIGRATSPAVRREFKEPRQTIMAVPAATTRPFDHHIFGEAGAKAAGLSMVFSNMGGKGQGQSCFIGCYRSSEMEGSSIWSLQSPYHGRAPGIWTYSFSGGAPLDDKETALVVADVNPIDTVMSKPARQVEVQPITLVAHIPFFIGTGKDNDALPGNVEALASRIIALDSIVPAMPSSCDLSLDHISEIRSICDQLSAIDGHSRRSLRMRSEGIQFVSMQPHVHPRLPILIDWAYIPHPKEAAEIDLPALDAIDISSMIDE